jgi:predicted enzyme related to lactoylglutathione lyase
MFDADRVKRLNRARGLPFQIGKIGHVVINVRDVAKSAEFYTQVLGFQISDVYPDEMVPGGMVFMRCNTDHHGIALVGSMEGAADNVELNHIAFEVPSLDDVIRAGDAAPAARLRSSSAIRTITASKSIGASTRSAARARRARRPNGTASRVSKPRLPRRCPART